MSAFKTIIKLSVFTSLVFCLVSCDEDKQASTPTDESAGDGGKIVKCSELDKTGSVDPASLKDAYTLPNGRRAVVERRRELSEQEASAAVPVTLKHREACSQVFDVLHRSNEPGYDGLNPLSALGGAKSYERSVIVDGSEVHAVPTKYRGLEIYSSIYEEVEVTCRAKRLSTKVVKRFQKLPAPLIGQCSFPLSYRAESPHILVQKNATVPDVKKVCLQKNAFEKSRCAEEHFSLGGLYRVARDNGYSAVQANVALAWALQKPDLSSIENNVRSALGLRATDALEISAAAEGIATADAFPVRAIGLSADGQVSGVQYWGLTQPQLPSNFDPSQRAARPILPQTNPIFEMSDANTEAEKLTAFSKKLRGAVGNSSVLYPWDREANSSPSGSLASEQSYLVGRSFRDAISASVEVGKPLSVFLVWSPTDSSRAVLTEVSVLSGGTLGRIQSKFIDDFSVLGLPENLLRM